MPLENLIRFPAIGDWGGFECALGLIGECVYYNPLQEFCAKRMDDLCVGLFIPYNRL